MVEHMKESGSLELVEETEGARRATEVSSTSAGAAAPAAADPEVLEQATRRRFSAKYKLRILEEADRCAEPGQIGALLRREGLYSSNLSLWREQRESGVLSGLTPRKRGRKPNPDSDLLRHNTQLRRENEKLRKRLARAETIIDVQKKVATLLGIPLNRPENDESD